MTSCYVFALFRAVTVLHAFRAPPMVKRVCLRAAEADTCHVPVATADGTWHVSFSNPGFST